MPASGGILDLTDIGNVLSFGRLVLAGWGFLISRGPIATARPTRLLLAVDRCRRHAEPWSKGITVDLVQQHELPGPGRVFQRIRLPSADRGALSATGRPLWQMNVGQSAVWRRE